jgi:hypothetical protein
MLMYHTVTRLKRRFYQFRYSYPHPNLLVISQKRSGSTWMRRMLNDVPGFVQFRPSTKRRADHRILGQDFEHVPVGYTVSKLHSDPTPSNIEVLHSLGRPYIVQVRDPRDIAVSWAHFVDIPHRRHAHPEMAGLDLEGRIAKFIEQDLDVTLQFAVGWRSALHPTLGLWVSYEDLLADTKGVMRCVTDHFKLGLTDAQLDAIVVRRSFKVQTGRDSGQEDASRFNRKGVKGDWANHFTDAHKDEFKRIAAGRLIELGYEQDDEW